MLLPPPCLEEAATLLPSHSGPPGLSHQAQTQPLPQCSRPPPSTGAGCATSAYSFNRRLPKAVLWRMTSLWSVKYENCRVKCLVMICSLKPWAPNCPLGHVHVETNLGNEVIVQTAWFSFNKEVASFRRCLMLSSTVLNSDMVPPYGCPGVPSIM